MDDLPSLPMTLSRRRDGSLTAGHPFEDKRLADAIAYMQQHAGRLGRRFWIHEDPRQGLTVSDYRPTASCAEVRPNGRVVFRPWS